MPACLSNWADLTSDGSRSSGDMFWSVTCADADARAACMICVPSASRQVQQSRHIYKTTTCCSMVSQCLSPLMLRINNGLACTWQFHLAIAPAQNCACARGFQLVPQTTLSHPLQLHLQQPPWCTSYLEEGFCRNGACLTGKTYPKQLISPKHVLFGLTGL